MVTPSVLAPMISHGPPRAGPSAPGPAASSCAPSLRMPMRLVNQVELGTSPRLLGFQAGPSSPVNQRTGSQPRASGRDTVSRTSLSMVEGWYSAGTATGRRSSSYQITGPSRRGAGAAAAAAATSSSQAAISRRARSA